MLRHTYGSENSKILCVFRYKLQITKRDSSLTRWKKNKNARRTKPAADIGSATESFGDRARHARGGRRSCRDGQEYRVCCDAIKKEKINKSYDIRASSTLYNKVVHNKVNTHRYIRKRVAAAPFVAKTRKISSVRTRTNCTEPNTI